jgi:glucokinase
MTGPIRLVGDIGGTNARFALAQDGAYASLANLHVADYTSLEAAITAYLSGVPKEGRPTEGALAVAGPVTGDVFSMTNSGWRFSRTDLAARFGLGRLELINDFTAAALSLPWLGSGDVVKLGGGAGLKGTSLAVLGPGTGLGVSGLLPLGDRFVPLQGEGGHATLPAVTPREVAVVATMRSHFDHVSAERAVCGPGLVNLYRALCELEGRVPALREPAEVLAAASTDALCNEAADLFCGFLGMVAGNLTLTLGAWGGLYIAGGIAPRMVDRLQRSDFRERMVAKGRFRTMLEEVPVMVITHPDPALVGLARLP